MGIVVSSDSYLKPAGFARKLSVALCLCVMLAANVAQALDSCELSALKTTHQVQEEHVGRTAPTFCLICVAAHASSLAAPIASIHPITSFVAALSNPPQISHFSPHILPLYVRPPPAV